MSDTPISTQDDLRCERPLDASVPLAQRYTLVKGRPTPVAAAVPIEVMSAEQVVSSRLADLGTALLKAGSRLPDTTMSLLCLVLQRADVSEGKAPKTRPYNAKDLPAGGEALLDLLEQMPEMGKLLGAESEPLSRALVRVAFLDALRESIEWTLPLIETHQAHALGELADIVDPTVDAVQSLLPRYPRMASILRDAILYKKGPADLALATRDGNAKVAAAARQDERSQLAAAAPAAPPAPLVVAPVVVPPPAATPAATPPPIPPAAGLPKKR